MIISWHSMQGLPLPEPTNRFTSASIHTEIFPRSVLSATRQLEPEIWGEILIYIVYKLNSEELWVEERMKFFIRSIHYH